MASELVPVRDYMDDKSIHWRTVKPDFELLNAKYMKEKTNNHAVGSLEKKVENIVKTWEMESTHKIRAEVSLMLLNAKQRKPKIENLLNSV